MPIEWLKDIEAKYTGSNKGTDAPEKLVSNVLRNAFKEQVGTFVESNIPPTLILDALVKIVGMEVAQILAALMAAGEIEEDDARKVILAAGVELTRAGNATLDPMMDRIAMIRAMMADAEEEEEKTE